MKRFRFSQTEREHIFRAWVAISIAFAIVLNGGKLFSGEILNLLVLSGLTVGAGFLLHELAHKYVAQNYGCWAEFRADNKMLILAIIMSFFGFVFAAPGAVVIQGTVTTKRNGIISVAGPATNLGLAAIFLGLSFLPLGMYAPIAHYGLLINAFIGVFNMIPFANIDGAKILRWNKQVYFITLGMGIALLAVSLI